MIFNANYLVCFVLYDPSLDQRILRKEQENILKLKIKLICWLILDKIQSTDFPYITLDTEQKEHIWHSYNNKARVRVVIEW